MDGLDGNKEKSQKRGFKTKKEAEEWYAHFRLQQSSDPTMTLADFWVIYKADMEKRLRKTTMKQKEYVMNDKVLPYFGSTPINEITAPMIRKWQGEMMEKGGNEKRGAWEKAGQMKNRIGHWRNFSGFRTQLWISRIHGLLFRFYSGRECVWENYLRFR